MNKKFKNSQLETMTQSELDDIYSSEIEKYEEMIEYDVKDIQELIDVIESKGIGYAIDREWLPEFYTNLRTFQELDYDEEYVYGDTIIIDISEVCYKYQDALEQDSESEISELENEMVTLLKQVKNETKMLIDIFIERANHYIELLHGEYNII